jgi:acetate kinase
MKILVINAGSSSLKFQLIDMDNESVIAKGICEEIGGKSGFKYKVPGREDYKTQDNLPTHSEALKLVLDTLVDEKRGVIKSVSEIGAVGHRIVHGGSHSESMLVTEALKEDIRKAADLAPLHNPAHLIGIEACEKIMNVPQVVVFDTGFHQSMPDYAYMYGLPYEYYEKYKIRRYGFHGTSHRFVSARAIEMLGRGKEGTKIVTCHLGNGASITAVKDGKCYDTTMGVTPLEGIMMGTRCGNIDPAIIPFLIRKGELKDADAIDKMMNKKSGMLGVSGKSSDNQDITRLAESGDERAILVEKMYTHQLTKFVAGYAGAMGGIDAIVFTGGIGENSGKYRSAVCRNLAFLGIEIDEEKNKIRGEEVDITTGNSKVKVYIIPTNEELVIARDTLAIVESM